MKHELEVLRAVMLSNLEAGQLIKRHLSDFANNATAITDLPLQNYIARLNTSIADYEPALIQAQKSDATEKIRQADADRDLAISAFRNALRLYNSSDNAAEVDASTSLSIVFKTYKDLANLNYEAETLGIDRLVNDLNSPVNAPKVAALNLQRYIDRLISKNETFKTISGGRLTTDALTQSFDSKTLRIQLFNLYGEFTHYVVAMANALDTPEFTNLLALINTTRKYYADLLAKRNGKNNAADDKTTTSTK